MLTGRSFLRVNEHCHTNNTSDYFSFHQNIKILNEIKPILMLYKKIPNQKTERH